MIGVYCITNTITGEKYVGASVSISARKRDHFGRNIKKYNHLKLYHDIETLGKDLFSFETLEECDKEILLEREQYWYDTLLPTYNTVRPAKCNFIYPEINKLAVESCRKPEHLLKLQKIHQSEQFIKNCREGQRYKYKAVTAMKNDERFDFDSFQEGARFIKDTTEYTSKNVASKIKAVCDGERKIAFGYTWEYKKV